MLFGHGHVRDGVDGLHGSHKAKFGNPLDVIRVKNLKVLHPMGKGPHRLFHLPGAECLKCIQDLAVGAVADSAASMPMRRISSLPRSRLP